MKTYLSSIPVLTISTVAATALILTPSALHGQPQQQSDKSVPLSKVERKNRAPVSKEILKVTLPKPQEATLPNGLTVLILEEHRLPTVSVQLQISGAGAIFDPADRAGLAYITAGMLMQGTATRSNKQIAEQIDALGATLTATAPFGSSATAFSASGLSDNFDQWFGVTTDVLLHPSFPPDELAKFKQRELAALRYDRTQPNFLVAERFSRAVYGDFAAANIAIDPKVLESLTSDDLKKWHDERYVPQNATLAIAGDVNAETLVPQLAKWFADWHKTDFAEPSSGNPAAVATRHVILVDRPGSVQTTIAIGNIGIDRRDPDFFALNVLNQIFGSGPQSRLFTNLRENKGYTYGVYSTFSALKYAGPIRAGGDVRTDVTAPALTEFFNEFNRMRDEKVTDTELEDAKHAVVAGFALSLESPSTLVTYAAIQKIYGFPADYWDTYPAKIMAVTADDVQRVAQKYLNPETMQIVAVGDASKIKAAMEKYGSVEMYGLDGKPVAAAASAPSSQK
jgi:zinc protease